MKNFQTLLSTISLLLLSGTHPLHAVGCDVACESDKTTMRVSAEHIEYKGIGYDKGYSSVDFFLAKDLKEHCFIPFVNAKAKETGTITEGAADSCSLD
jgi:hypothetical protein